MPNPFVNNVPSNNLNNIQNVYKMLMNSRDPKGLFIQLAQQNPQLRPIAQALQQGGNPQAIFNQICQQRGVNPDEFIRSITGNNTNSR